MTHPYKMYKYQNVRLQGVQFVLKDSHVRLLVKFRPCMRAVERLRLDEVWDL